MRTRLLSICTALAICTLWSATARAESIDDVFKKMRDKFKGYKTIQFKTTMTNEIAMGGRRVNGKPCYVIEMIAKNPIARQAMGRMVGYFDKDNFVQIKSMAYTTDGKVMGTSTTTDIKTDANIPADRFVFKAPAGVTVTDMTK